MPLSDAQLHPLLDAAGDALLRRLRQHPHGPRYNHRIGERLSAEGLASIHAFARSLQDRDRDWLAEFLAPARRDVPFYRSQSMWSEHLADLPILRRDDLRNRPWDFVPDSAALDDLIVYTTSGTTGASLQLPATPEVPNRYLPLFQQALAAHGVTLRGGARVSIIQVCAQDKTVTNCSVMSYLGGAGFAKINLSPGDWNHPDDPIHFLDDCDAEIYTGDPFAFHTLMQLPLKTRPKALISLATALFPGLRRQLESHFRCPVVDIYSLNEAGPVAFSEPDDPTSYRVFTHKIHVEIIEGQIILTGGINPMLPLVRYATGDYAALDTSTKLPTLRNFEGRPPVLFRATDGRIFNSVDVSTTLHPFALPTLRLHQNADHSLTLETHADDSQREEILTQLRILFGVEQAITWKSLHGPRAARKPVSYSSDLNPIKGTP